MVLYELSARTTRLLLHRLLRAHGGRCPSLADYVRGAAGPREAPQRVNVAYAPFDTSYPQISGTYARRHVKNAFRADATTNEILQVLKLLVVQGVQPCNLGVAILAEELDRTAANPDPKT